MADDLENVTAVTLEIRVHATRQRGRAHATFGTWRDTSVVQVAQHVCIGTGRQLEGKLNFKNQPQGLTSLLNRRSKLEPRRGYRAWIVFAKIAL